MYSCVMFDLDGTLLDTLADLAGAGNHVLRSFGYPVHPVERYKTFIGNGIPTLIRRMLPDGCGEDVQAEALERFAAYYGAHVADFTRPYDGVPELLRRLRERGLPVGVVSNKAHPFTVQLLRRFFGEDVGEICGTGPGMPRKPDPACLFRVMRALGAEARSVLYGGDSEVDIAVARAASVDVCAVLWGFRSASALKGADFLVSRVEALEALLLS